MHHTLRYQVGQSIAGRFYIHEIRLGGMGEVYLCFDKEAREPVALKTFQTASQKYDDIKNLFNTEVLAWIKIGKHPNIVRCYWMDYLDAHPFMALEWIFNDSHYGITLRDWLCSGALDMQLALSFAIDICRGLVHANQQHDGIVHRDLKPENILIGQGYLAKITDFGLAQFANIFEYMDLGEQDDNHQRSQEAQVKGLVGTPPYMAPEQWLEDEVIDPRADIYAIGCIMHEMLTGASPFETPLSSASYPRKRQRLEYWRQQHLFNSPTFLSSNFPIRLGEIIQTCLAKQREKRFTSCEHLLQDLTLLYEELFHAPPKTLSISSEPTKEDYLNQGMTYVNLGQYEEALTAYQHATSLEPTNAEILARRGVAYAHVNRFDEAIVDHNLSISMDPINGFLFGLRASSYVYMKRYKEALDDFKQAIKLSPDNHWLYENLGGLYLKLEDQASALDAFNDAVRTNAWCSYSYYERGEIYRLRGYYELALQDFGRAIEIKRDYSNAIARLGATYKSIGRFEDALYELNRAIKLKPRHAWAIAERGETLQFLGSSGVAVSTSKCRSTPRTEPAIAIEIKC